MTIALLRRQSAVQLAERDVTPFDAETLEGARRLVEEVARGGEPALRACCERFDQLAPEVSLRLDREQLERALAALPRADRELLERTASRVRAFAEAQRAALADVDVPVEGGRAGSRWTPVETAGCYAPGGRFALPSSVLMTVIPARVAGVERCVVATPRADPVSLAAAALAGADELLLAGGAHAVAALAYGVVAPRCDVIVGPGNRWVTAAKHVVSERVGIDMLAGPSELLVVASADADAELIAADLLAQAEHDVDAVPILIADSEVLLAKVDAALARQLVDLPTADTARAALGNGSAVLLPDMGAAAALCQRVAPEHLSLQGVDAEALASCDLRAGAVFLGSCAAEAFGDYGLGPNHVLPTGRTARHRGGLSVADFMRCGTWLELERGEQLGSVAEDAARLARLEGLEAHARSAELRRAP